MRMLTLALPRATPSFHKLHGGLGSPLSAFLKILLLLLLLFGFGFFFETGFLCVAPAVLELTL